LIFWEHAQSQRWWINIIMGSVTNFLEMMTWNSGDTVYQGSQGWWESNTGSSSFLQNKRGRRGVPTTPPPTIKLELVGKSGLKEEVHISLEEEDTSLFYQPKPFICLPLLNVIHINIYYLKMLFFFLINLSSRTQALIPTYPYFP
jgi:hypothetical protein